MFRIGFTLCIGKTMTCDSGFRIPDSGVLGLPLLPWVQTHCVEHVRRLLSYFKQEPIQRRFDFSDVLYFGWPNQPSSGTMRVYIELLLCTYIYIYIYIVNGCYIYIYIYI